MDAYPTEAWERLGQHLQQRRPQIDSRYRIRRVFAAENGLTDKTVQEIENAYRTTFTPVMLSTIEAAYRLKPGAIEDVLAGGEFEPVEPVVRVSQPKLTVPDPPGLRIADLDETRVHIDYTVDTETTMDEVYERLGEVSAIERAMIASMEAQDTPPSMIGGAVLMVREINARKAALRAQREAAARREA